MILIDLFFKFVVSKDLHPIELLDSDQESCPQLTQFVCTNPISYLTDKGLVKVLQLRANIEQRIKEGITTQIPGDTGETIEDIKLDRINCILNKIDASSFLSLYSNQPISSVVEYLRHPQCPTSHKEAAKSSAEIATLLKQSKPTADTFDTLIIALKQQLIDKDVIMAYMLQHCFSLLTYLSKNEKHSDLTVQLFKSIAKKLNETKSDDLIPFIVSASAHPQVLPLAIKAVSTIKASESEATRGQASKEITKAITATLKSMPQDKRKEYIASIGELGRDYQMTLISRVKRHTPKEVIDNMRDMFDEAHRELLASKQEQLAS